MIVRFDYEGLDPRAAFYLMRDLEAVISDKAFTSQKFAVGDHMYSVEKADNFEYIDPVDGTVARNQVSVRKAVTAGCCMTRYYLAIHPTALTQRSPNGNIQPTMGNTPVDTVCTVVQLLTSIVQLQNKGQLPA